ncbi:unnamed protein product [Coregonus sp. 'balchen']|nr:unnamed protein product [Coregonus sp. 'balchen']
MSMSTFQKVTLVSCLVLCVALLLPKMLLGGGKKGAQTEGSGRFPPMVHRQMAPDSQGQRAAGSTRAHNTEAITRAKGGGGTGITSKGKSAVPTEPRFPSVRAENRKRKITDFELTQLQDKLRETEMVMERIVSKASYSPERVTGVSADQEERLLLQLREITRVMQEGRLVEGVAPAEMGAQHYEGFPEDPHPCWEEPFCGYDNTQATSTEEQPERTDECGADQKESGAYQEKGGAYQEAGRADQERWADQDKGGSDQEEGVANEEESGVDQEEGRADQKEGAAEDDVGVAEAGADLNTDDEGGADLATGNEEGGAKCDVGGTEVEKEVMYSEEGGANDKLGVADKDRGGAEEELEFTLKMSVLEREEKDSVNLSTSRFRVRRKRNKKQKK